MIVFDKSDSRIEIDLFDFGVILIYKRASHVLYAYLHNARKLDYTLADLFTILQTANNSSDLQVKDGNQMLDPKIGKELLQELIITI